MKRVLLSVSILNMLLACSTNDSSNYSQLQCLSDDAQDRGTFNCTLIIKDEANDIAKAVFLENAILVNRSTCSVSVKWDSGRVVRRSFRGRPAYDMFLWGKNNTNLRPTTINTGSATVGRLQGTAQLPRLRGGCGEILEGFQ